MILLGGHRGFGCTDNDYSRSLKLDEKPVENTVSSFIKAFDSGADFIEFDTVKTKDDHIVIIHSNQLSDHFFSDLDADFIADLTLSEIQSMRSGPKQNGMVPTLEETLQTIFDHADLNSDYVANIEIKDVKGTNTIKQSIVPLILNIVNDGPLPMDKIVFSSFSIEDIRFLKERCPKARTGFLFDTNEQKQRPIYKDPALDNEIYTHCTIENIQSALQTTHIDFIHPEIHSLNHDIIQYCASQDLSINSWALNENLPHTQTKQIETVVSTCNQYGVNLGIITDYVPEMKKALSSL